MLRPGGPADEPGWEKKGNQSTSGYSRAALGMRVSNKLKAPPLGQALEDRQVRAAAALGRKTRELCREQAVAASGGRRMLVVLSGAYD